MKNDLKVGQTLFFVYHDRRRGTTSEVEVTKVGRKWAELSNLYRIDVKTLQVDGGQYTSPGRCYLNAQEYEAFTKLTRAWTEFRRAIERQYSPPEGVSVEDMLGALERVRIAPLALRCLGGGFAE